MAYQVKAYRGDSGDAVATVEARTARAARSIAWALAQRVRPAGVTAHPVWVEGGGSWNDPTVIGGYDAGGDVDPGGACAVVHRD